MLHSYIGLWWSLYYVAASTNLVGKFTQSVRRIVQDVKDEGTSSKYKRYFIRLVLHDGGQGKFN